MFRTISLVLLFSATLVAGVSANPEPSAKDIPRFKMVDNGFYRGGQPEAAGFEFLKQQGIKTVINLRNENDEEHLVRELGMNYVHLPMSVTVWSKIPQSAINEYFKILANSDNFPIFIHCRRGADRTGAMVGFYQIAFHGYDGKKAYDEARDIGMRWWYPGLKKQLFGFKAPTVELPPILPAAIVQPAVSN